MEVRSVRDAVTAEMGLASHDVSNVVGDAIHCCYRSCYGASVIGRTGVGAKV